MESDSLSQRKAQLDKKERDHLEDVVVKMRERVEDNVEFQLTQKGLDDRPEDVDSLDEETQQLVEAVELEAPDDESWSEAFDEYVTGVGYTIVNRLAALRCMEVRDFIREEVTVFKEDGLTPAAETLVREQFLLEEEAILAAYHNACDDLAEEIEILFDRSSAYSLIDPDDDTFEDLCEMIDSVEDEVWRADDVLGWVYQYYNVKLLDDLRRKGDREGLEPKDVPPANQFYTPHWVVRMLTDNSLGKLYLEHTGELQDAVDTQQSLTSEDRKNRSLLPDESPDIEEFCTYLVPTEGGGEPTDFEHPRELRVIDPACGSGHFLLYAFNVLERIWRAETDFPAKQIPEKILQYNLYGVDLDMRACQLAAFNLYLKARTRAESEGADSFDMPELGVVCADATIAEIDGVEEIFEEVADENPEVQVALERILDAFEEVHGLGSLLDVRGTLGDLFVDDDEIRGTQLTLADNPRENDKLGQVLHRLSNAVEERREANSLLAQDLRSFVRLLDILSHDYDVALMNPPYGSGNRMPDVVQDYVEENYRYKADFYISFFEACNRFTAENGRIGMLIPRQFMYKGRFTEFREDFVGSEGSFDFLAEFGEGVLDNAKVRTVGSVINTGAEQNPVGNFYRLHDVPTERKENKFADLLCGDEGDIKRVFEVPLQEFQRIPRTPICYSAPQSVRGLYKRDLRLDADQAGIEGKSVCWAVPGVVTSNDDRFVRRHWEVMNFDDHKPLSNGGPDAWILPEIDEVIRWAQNGRIMKRSSSSVRTPNSHLYGRSGLTWTHIKETGRRFGYYPGGIFSTNGFMLFPRENISLWTLLAAMNSTLFDNLFLSQTTERHWSADSIGAVPWVSELEGMTNLQKKCKKQYQIKCDIQSSNPTSPQYVGPSLLRGVSEEEFFYEHPHNEELDIDQRQDRTTASILEACRKEERAVLKRRQRLETLSEEIDEIIFSHLTIPEEQRAEMRDETFLRTSEDSEDREVSDPESVSEIPENVDEQVEDLVHHFAMEAVREEDDGIVPLHSVGDQPSILDRIVERFEDAYGEHAEDRLIEVDEILGAESATEEAYPNLRRWITENLFDYHVSRMENTPIVWKLTTERLLADSNGRGFVCFVDYHSLSSGLFDRLTNQYLEPQKAELREQRSAANRRRSDESLTASEQAEAAEQYERCASGLDQIAVFEDVVQNLASVDEREFDEADRTRVENLAPKVATFREETRERVDTLSKLYESSGSAWFKNTFSEKFWETVDEWRDEWLNALAELEGACEAYAKPTDEPVEAHLADLFDYFNWRLKGSDHYSSSGILFMTYYFEREGSDLLDENGQPHDHLSEDERRLASLAMGIDDVSIVDEEYLEAVADIEGVDDIKHLPPIAEFKALAKEIDDRCQTIREKIPSNWSDRALSEVTTAGYQPNQKHGVKINITPLAEAEIVPKTVDDQVL